MSLNLKPSLIAYLQSGWRMSCGVAVDFTLSNKPYDDPRSLHSQDMQRVGNMNEYERAIFEVGKVLEPYTLEDNFHMLGFGGQPGYLESPEENFQPHKCWNLTGKPWANILGAKTGSTSEMLRTYHNAIMNTKLRGPTYFKPIIERFIQIADAELKNYPYLYFIFVILTDGSVHDMDETKRILVEMSAKPISVIIVGMGEN
jgi:hypothetical protein